MRTDRRLIGAESEDRMFVVRGECIRRFARAVGDRTPEHVKGETAPPTFATVLRVDVPDICLDGALLLHGAEEYLYERPIRHNDRLWCRSRIVDIRPHRGRLGPATMLVTEHVGCDDLGHRVFTSRSTILISQYVEGSSLDVGSQARRGDARTC
ncbi:MaoC family dehydratase N-terminal domain-containing protein [Thermaerobacter composti]|uniref:MaoC family dehydratase N-terminal domain-containing protein n=1 Tax=Thermaerobacter composti TaxID=554949 RepID=A0ABZ0QNV7_9FIRM|nr:MaoC family dehydratase N-terminal domain-containing protein [Thermaerobacter composti]WPD18452.1 MaoC family dehydratase N-terminal domain-containing protein [Thermaerobacter composti]